MSLKKRVRTDKAKEARRKKILSSAARLIDRHGFSGLTMDQVAHKNGVAKGTLYLYFRTREELILSVLVLDFTQWFTRMKKHIQTHPQPFAEDFLDIWLLSLQDCPRLATGLTYLHLLIEPNITEDFALEWKRFLLAQTKELHYEILQNFRTSFSLTQLAQFLSMLTGLTVGLWMQSTGAPQILKIYKENPELQIFSPPFEETFRFAAKALLRGSPLFNLKCEKKL